MKKIFFLTVVIAFSCIAQVRAQAGTPPIRKADISPARPRAAVSLPMKSSGGAVVTAKTPTPAPIRSTDPGGSGKTSKEALFTKPAANSQGAANARSLPPSALPVRQGKDSLQKTGGQ
jgi:hypothetical protein